MSESVVQVHVDTQTMVKAEEVLRAKGISISQAMGMTIRQIAYDEDFEIPHIPNALTADTLNKSERNEEVHEAKDLADLMRQLEED